MCSTENSKLIIGKKVLETEVIMLKSKYSSNYTVTFEYNFQLQKKYFDKRSFKMRLLYNLKIFKSLENLLVEKHPVRYWKTYLY